MLRASIAFFVIGCILITLGVIGVGVSFEDARELLFVCLSLAVLFFVGSLVSGHHARPPV